jgi:hypothetical protein
MACTDLTLRDLWVAALTRTSEEAAGHFELKCKQFRRLCKERGLKTWPHRQLCAFGNLMLSPLLDSNERAFIEDLLIRAPTGGLDLDANQYKRVKELKARMYRRATNLSRRSRASSTNISTTIRLIP